MRTSTTALCTVSAILLLAGCTPGGNDTAAQKAIEKETGGTASVSNDGQKMHVETSEGSFDVGGTTMPADWPTDVPAYAGADVMYSASMNPATGKPGNAVVLMTTDDAAKVGAFYKEQLKANGWTMTTTMESQGTVILGGTKDDRTLSMMVGPSDDKTSITIGIEKAAK